ncbi:efflux RND transporter periplasmic adaptor subunit [Candidatus Gottesmanbacteria bacterium]|nr:efflux RND transporter periplasmic adaptor subunit [Candidatus Gottesmanbacteria bacterium]
MGFIDRVKTKLISGMEWYRKASLIKKIAMVVVIALIGWLTLSRFAGKSSGQIQYQTAQALKGTLVVSLSASGQVSSANSASVTTQTSGVISKIFVKNGDVVKSGDPIAQVDLDMNGKQRASQALASYQNAKNQLASTQVAMFSLQSTMFSKWKTYTDIAENSTYQNPDGSPNAGNRTLTPFTTVQNDWLAAEAQYANQQNVVTAAQTSVGSAWASYQQSSPTIYAPISGVISGLSLQIGSVLTSQTSSTGTSTSQRIANIKTTAAPVAVVNLSEIDVPKVQLGDKVTLTMDAFSGQTFTGKIVSIDTTGTVSSGVTTYPAYIQFDTEVNDMYPNMGVDGKIITDVKDNVIIVPNSAIKMTNGQTTVSIMKNRKVSSVDVTTGAASDSETEIVSGINEGDVVVTGSTTIGSRTSSATTSPFNALGGRGFGGGAFRGGGR